MQPRYDQISLKAEERHNRLQQILSPHPDDEGVWIHQDAWFYLGHFDENTTATYNLKKKGNGVYVFVLEGQFEIAEQLLERRDGMGISDSDVFTIKSLSADAEILLMEVPMMA